MQDVTVDATSIGKRGDPVKVNSATLETDDDFLTAIQKVGLYHVIDDTEASTVNKIISVRYF